MNHRLAPLTAALLLTASAVLPAFANEAPKAPKTVRWVLAHTRADDAYRPMFDAFARRVAEKSGGELKIEYVSTPLSDDNGNAESHRMVLDGSADMGQFEREFAEYVPAVTAPFAFRGYAHAEAVFTGPVGRKLLDSLYASSDRKLRALAFTYSGGQRGFLGAAAITKVSDLKGRTVETPGNSGWSPLRDEVLAAAGVKLVPEKESRPESIDLLEAAVNRSPLDLKRHPEIAKKLKFVNLTNHGLLVTAVVANEKFLAGLAPAQRKLLVEEIENLAVQERKFSIALEPKRLKVLEEMGLKPVEMSAAERRKFMDIGEAVLRKHPELHKAVEEIRAVREDGALAGL